jgi:ABC-type multidrug transport system fused ATPase/permease subunit
VIRALTAIYAIVSLGKITRAIETQDKNLFFLWIGILFCIFLINLITSYARKIEINKILRDTRTYLDIKYLHTMTKADNTYMERLGTGRSISIVQKWIYTWIDILIETFVNYFQTFLVLVLTFFYIGTQSLLFLFISLWFFVLSVFWVQYFGKRAHYRRKKSKDIVTEQDRWVVRRVMSKFEILQQNKFSVEEKKRRNMAVEQFGYRNHEKFWQRIGYNGVVFFANILFVVLTAYMWYLAFVGATTLASFVLMTWLGMQITREFGKLSDIGKKLSDDLIHIEKLRETFDYAPRMETYKTGKTFRYAQWHIELHDVSFSYTAGTPIFKNFSLDILGGKKTALVGHSGGGKTTIIKLLAGYIVPDAGEVLVDGQRLCANPSQPPLIRGGAFRKSISSLPDKGGSGRVCNSISLQSYYKHIGYLSQDPSVFDGTVRENLAYFLTKEPTKKQLEKVISLARCEFIWELPEGLDTHIGERGIRLSGGQKQRLAIAKIMLKNPEIILLDEPTSALDSMSEQKIAEAFENLFVDKTVVVVAHRLQTVKSADEIIVLEKWNIVQRGTHTQLQKIPWTYKDMLDLQTTF